MADNLICMAEIVGAQGIKGLVKLKVFGDDPLKLTGYGPLSAPDGKTYTLNSVTPHGSIWIAEVKGVTDRTVAEKLRGTRLHMDRALLPKIKKENTFYHADLIGLAEKYPDGKPMGKVITVANFGAGDLLEIKPIKGSSFYVPFTNAIVPEVNMTEKTVTINPPLGLLD